MKTFPVLNVFATLGSSDIIGASAGKRAALRLIDAVGAAPGSAWLALDFNDIDMVSASAAREAFLTDFTKHLHSHATLPVYLNLNSEALDEIVFAATALGIPLVTAARMEVGEPAGLTIRGAIDAKQLHTLRVVAELGEADASAAHNLTQADSGLGITAWNNRLANLASVRLLRERKSGKTKYYSLPLKGLVDGNGFST